VSTVDEELEEYILAELSRAGARQLRDLIDGVVDRER
jgi:hypothetical protein